MDLITTLFVFSETSGKITFETMQPICIRAKFVLPAEALKINRACSFQLRFGLSLQVQRAPQATCHMEIQGKQHSFSFGSNYLG